MKPDLQREAMEFMSRLANLYEHQEVTVFHRLMDSLYDFINDAPHGEINDKDI